MTRQELFLIDKGYSLTFNELIILDTLSGVTFTIFAIYSLLAKQLPVSSL